MVEVFCFAFCTNCSKMKRILVQRNACVLSHVQLFYDHMNCSPPSISVHGIFPARILEWVAISSSRGSSQSRDWSQGSCVSCTGRQILYHCTIWEAQVLLYLGSNTSCAIYNMSLNKEPKPSFPWFPYCILYRVSAPSPVLFLRWIPVAGKHQGPPMILTYFLNGLLHSNLIVHSHDWDQAGIWLDGSL